MQVIAQWTGGQADALRQALRMTNESFAGHLGVAVRTVAYWRNRPGMTPQPQMQEVLDAALEQAPDHAKAQFALLVSETADAPGDQPCTGSPFSVSLEDMTSAEWNQDDACQLSLSFDSSLERWAVEDIERLSHLWLICDPPQVIELNAGRRTGDALVSAVEHRVVQLRRADDFITGTASRDLMRAELAATTRLLSEGTLTEDQARRVLTAIGELAQLGARAASSSKPPGTSGAESWPRVLLAMRLLPPTSSPRSATSSPIPGTRMRLLSLPARRIRAPGMTQRQ